MTLESTKLATGFPDCPVKRFALTFAGFLLAASSFAASATTTLVNPVGNTNGSERCLAGFKCSGGTYDGALSLISIFEKDLGFAYGSFVRVDDALDKVWANTLSQGGQVQALARYAGDSSKLGYDAGDGYFRLTNAPGDHKVLVNHKASFFHDTRSEDLVKAPDSWITIPLAAGVPFAFVFEDLSMNYKITSNPGSGVGGAGYANSGLPQLDYMVTFKVPGEEHYFIAWEDRNPLLGNTGDRDYNDLVVEVQFANPTNPVPEPETYALMLAGLGFLGFATRRRRLKS